MSLRHLRTSYARIVSGALIVAATIAPIEALAATDSTPGVPAFVIDGGTTVTFASAAKLTLDCDLRNYGAFTPGANSAVIFYGYGSPLVLGVPTFRHLGLLLHGTVALGNATSVTGQLLMAAGNLSLAGHDLTVNMLAGGSAGSYVVTPDTLGRLVRTVDGSTNAFFPVGNAGYDPMLIRTGSGSDVFRVAVMDSVATGGLAQASALSRSWVVSHPNADGVNGTLVYAVQWNAGEQGASFDRTLGGGTSAVAWHRSDAAWYPMPGVRTSDNGAYPAVDTLRSALAGMWTLADGAGVAGVFPGTGGPAREVELGAAFPNPFHAVTSIRYALPVRTAVSLAVYSVTGQRVATLADGVQEPGTYVVPLRAQKLPGGVYFYRLQAGDNVQTRKVVLY